MSAEGPAPQQGTAYGDFTRSSFDAAKQYRSVLMQQGRVQLDADWNDQGAIDRQLLTTAIADLVGPHAVPADAPGFGIRPVVALHLEPGARARTDVQQLVAGMTGPLTLELRLRASAEAGSVLWCGAPGGAAPGGFGLWVDAEGCLVFGRAYEAGGGASQWVEVTSAAPVATDRWAEVVVVAGTEEVTLYVDSHPSARGATPSPVAVPLPGHEIVLGGPVSPGAAGGFSGDLAGLRVWSLGLAPAELRALTGRGLGSLAGGPAAPGLLAWWPLRDGTGHASADLVGGTVMSLEGGHWRLLDLAISAGRFYLEGELFALGRDTRYTEQPTAPHSRLPTAPGRYLLYLEGWERSVSAIEDPSIRDPALGGLDTTARTQAVAAVRCAPMAEGASPRTADVASLLDEDQTRVTTGRMRATHSGAAPVGNYLYRVEVHRGGDTRASVRDRAEAVVLAVEVARREVVLAADALLELELGAEIDILASDRSGRVVEGRFVVEAAIVVERHLRLRLAGDMLALAAFERHRLRRAPSAPSFKWSRTNGSVMVPVAAAEPGSSTVRIAQSSRPDVPLRVGDAVELVDDRSQFLAHPGRLLEVTEVTLETDEVRLNRPPAVLHPTGALEHAFLRRWDNPCTGAGTEDGAVVIAADRWVELEDGIEVSFAHGAYRSGDYWWVVSRQEAERALLWPEVDGHPAALSPTGVGRHWAPLAWLQLDGHGVECVDLRRQFSPLYGDAPRRDVPRRGGVPSTAKSSGGRGTAAGAPTPSPSAIGPPPPSPTYGPGSTPTPTPSSWPAADLGLVGASPAATQPQPTPAGSATWANRSVPGDDWQAPLAGAPPAEPTVPDGGAVVVPAGEVPAGFVPSSVEVLTRPTWSQVGLVTTSAPVAGIAAVGENLVLATVHDLFRVESTRGAVDHLVALPEGRSGFSFCAAGHSIFLFGGALLGGKATPDVLEYDLHDGAWRARRPLPTKLANSAVALVGDEVHLLGGAGRSRPGRHHLVYDLVRDIWHDGTALLHAREGAAAAALEDGIHLLGGRHDRSHGAHHLLERATQAWKEAVGPPVVRKALAAAAPYGDRLALVIAHAGEELTSVLHAFDAGRGAWDALPELPVGVAHPVTTSAAGHLVVAGNNQGRAIVQQLPPDQRYQLVEPAARRPA